MSAKEPVVLWISRVGGEPFTAPNLYVPTARMKFHAYPPAYVPALEAEVAALRAERDEAVAKWNRAEYDADKVRAERDRAERERDAAVALLADARKCVSLVNANGYYDNWLARCARVIERSAP